MLTVQLLAAAAEQREKPFSEDPRNNRTLRNARGSIDAVLVALVAFGLVAAWLLLGVLQ